MIFKWKQLRKKRSCYIYYIFYRLHCIRHNLNCPLVWSFCCISAFLLQPQTCSCILWHIFDFELFTFNEKLMEIKQISMRKPISVNLNVNAVTYVTSTCLFKYFRMFFTRFENLLCLHYCLYKKKWKLF